MVPLYPLYALLFVDAGLSERQVTGLFALWTLVAVGAEVPCGALADRVSRRGALVAAGVVQAAAYGVWLIQPTFAGFALGFLLWGVSGSLAGGAFQALLHDGLRAGGAEERLAQVLGRAEAAALAVQLPVAGLATALFALGSFTLVGLASVATCLLTAALALSLPDHRPPAEDGPADREESAYLAILRAGTREALARGAVRGVVVAVGLLAAFEAIEEYTPLLAGRWGVPTAAVPVVLLAIPLAGALGAAAGARLERSRPMVVGAVTVGAALCLTGAVLLDAAVGVAGVAFFYGAWKAVEVVADVRLQQRIRGEARATVTSVSGLAAELAALGMLGLWAAGGAGLTAVGALAAALLVPWLLGRPAGAPAGHDEGRPQEVRRSGAGE